MNEVIFQLDCTSYDASFVAQLGHFKLRIIRNVAREFWQRAEDRNACTNNPYARLHAWPFPGYPRSNRGNEHDIDNTTVVYLYVSIIGKSPIKTTDLYPLLYNYLSIIGKNPIFDEQNYKMDFRAEIKKHSGQPLTRQVLMDLLQDYKRPYDKINELIKQELLVQLKRGVFIPGPQASMPAPEKLLLANHLWGPSYVSSDSALSHWGMIPERIHETLSMTTNLAKIYKTPVGRFRYIRLPLPYYSFGIQRTELAFRQVALIASKEKALCDKIITTQRLKLRSVKQARDYIMEDLRISRDTLRELNTRVINDYLKAAPKADSILILIKTLNDL